MVNFMIPMVAAAAVVAAMPAKRQTSFGTAKIINNCNQNLTLYSVGSQAQGPFVLAANTGTYSEPYRVDPSSGGIALKVQESKPRFDGQWLTSVSNRFSRMVRTPMTAAGRPSSRTRSSRPATRSGTISRT